MIPLIIKVLKPNKELVEFTNKKELRQYFLDLLKHQKEEDRIFKSQQIADQLFESPEFQSCKKVLFYASMVSEVQTGTMMQRALDQNKKVFLPVVNKALNIIEIMAIRNLQQLKTGAFGIQEPVDISEKVSSETIDMAVVPGVAFDRSNNRLGRGGGYYDRLLSELPSNIPTVGLAYDIQYVDHLSFLQDHDIPVSRVISN